MINKLTENQKEKMLEVRDYWIDKVYECSQTDEEASRKLIKYMYALAGFAKPKVIFADSPLSANIIANLLTGDSVGDSVGYFIWNSASVSVRDSIRDSVWSSVRDSVWSSVSASVRDSVSDSVWSSLEKSGIKTYTRMSYGEVWHQGWLAFYDFFTRQTQLVRHPEFEKYIDFVDKANAYYILPFEKVCIISRAPKYIHKNFQDGRYVMHNNEGGMAIEWSDGWGQYVLNGITLEKDMYDEILKGTASFKKVMSIENIEHRMLYLKYMNVDNMLNGSNAQLINTGSKPSYQVDKKGYPDKATYNQLYLVEKNFEQDEYFLRYVDPSTGRVYLSGIDPQIGAKEDADLAMAWKFAISKKEYIGIKVQS